MAEISLLPDVLVICRAVGNHSRGSHGASSGIALERRDGSTGSHGHVAGRYSYLASGAAGIGPSGQEQDDQRGLAHGEENYGSQMHLRGT